MKPGHKSREVGGKQTQPWFKPPERIILGLNSFHAVSTWCASLFQIPIIMPQENIFRYSIQNGTINKANFTLLLPNWKKKGRRRKNNRSVECNVMKGRQVAFLFSSFLSVSHHGIMFLMGCVVR